MTCLLKQKSFDCRVSSVLNKDVRSYGKKFLYDDCDETCWNSDSGTPQWILIDFKEECKLGALEIQFQGGFAGKDCHLEAGPSSKDLDVVECFYPEDTNKLQRFQLEKETVAKTFKLSFQESTDFFDLWTKYSAVFPHLWAATAFKGATGSCQQIPVISHHIEKLTFRKDFPECFLLE